MTYTELPYRLVCGPDDYLDKGEPVTTPKKATTSTPGAVTVTSNALVSDAVVALEHAAEVYAGSHLKPGFRTSELYVALLTLADDLLVSRFHNDFGLKAHQALVLNVVSSVVGLGYLAARTYLKARHVKVVAK